MGTVLCVWVEKEDSCTSTPSPGGAGGADGVSIICPGTRDRLRSVVANAEGVLAS